MGATGAKSHANQTCTFALYRKREVSRPHCSNHVVVFLGGFDSANDLVELPAEYPRLKGEPSFMPKKLIAVLLIFCLATSALAAPPPPPTTNNDPWYNPILYWVVSQWSHPNYGASFRELPGVVQQILSNMWQNWFGYLEYYNTAPEI